MTVALLVLIVYVPATLLAGRAAAREEDRGYVLRVILFAWLFFGPLTGLFDLWLPFSDDGDDQEYFRVATSTIGIRQGLLSLTRFVGVMEQPGYPLLLSLLRPLAGTSLLAYKLHNLGFLILLAVVWYRIAVALEPGRLARVVLVAVLLLTPLWYYVFILRKELSIALLQSIFLLGLVRQWQRPGAGPWILMGVSTAVLGLFRLPLIAQNALVALGTLLARSFSRAAPGGRVLPVVIAVTVFLLMASAVSNPEFLIAIGMSATRAGALDPRMLSEAIIYYNQLSTVSGLSFPALYLFTETAAWSPDMWRRLDATWLRAVLAVPWMFIVVPTFMLGLLWLLRPADGEARRGPARLFASRLLSSPWTALVMFVASSLAISWAVGETTRWRIPDMPAIATIAAAGWIFSAPRLRQEVVAFWVCGLAMLFSAYYLLRQF